MINSLTLGAQLSPSCASTSTEATAGRAKPAHGTAGRLILHRRSGWKVGNMCFKLNVKDARRLGPCVLVSVDAMGKCNWL